MQQLSSLADQFGKLNKVLLLSPLFFQSERTSKALSQFEDYCKGHGVRLCRTKDELLALFKKDDPPPSLIPLRLRRFGGRSRITNH